MVASPCSISPLLNGGINIVLVAKWLYSLPPSHLFTQTLTHRWLQATMQDRKVVRGSVSCPRKLDLLGIELPSLAKVKTNPLSKMQIIPICFKDAFITITASDRHIVFPLAASQ